jgi:hypothetical protein
MYVESDLERAKQGKMMVKRMQKGRISMRRMPSMVLRVW